jgi:hypothetical protein
MDDARVVSRVVDRVDRVTRDGVDIFPSSSIDASMSSSPRRVVDDIVDIRARTPR